MATTKVEAIKEKIDAARARQKALEAELRKAENRASQFEKRRAERKKFILGNYLNKRMDADPEFAKTIMADLARELDRNVDRALFCLPEIEEKSKRRGKKQPACDAAPVPVAPVQFGEKPRPAQSFDDIVDQLKNS